MNGIKSIVAAITIALGSQAAWSEGNQVFYRYGIASLGSDRGGQVFTDTNGASGKNDSKSGWNISAGLDLSMLKDVGPGDIFGEVMVDYAHYSKKSVRQTTSALLSGTAQSQVAVTGLSVIVAPKYKFTGFLDGKLRPWIIPIGLAFLVQSPPSNDSTYLDIGYHLGVGVEYAVWSALTVGIDFRDTIAAKDGTSDLSNNQFDLYAAINF